MNPSDQLQLTVEDKDRYEKRISEIDLNDIPMVLKEVPKKLKVWYRIQIFLIIRLN